MIKVKENLTWLILAVAIFSAVLIAVFDAGSSASQGSGAGDIWWVDAEEVEQSYQNLTQNQ
ncbi:hypothetical protein [Dethiobacter alkaliphilus]|uniref:hypothetical protein n=1 Tax=Dethiobacter alkaliphilus TaxID=427926 RepID=UPI002225CC50|nr:hypothetical protein [Dethiobacter alkaliphilus]MCW3491253.1 hypothetical protein [Dethiobacter alkaliphilus]